MRLNGTVTQPLPPQQPATPPGTYPPSGAYVPQYPAAPKKSYVGLIIGIIAAFFVLLAGMGVGGYFVYRAIGDDHCGTVAGAAASAATSAMTFEPGMTKESYLDRNRGKWTAAGLARIENVIGPMLELQKVNPSTVSVRVAEQSVKECQDGRAKVLLVLHSTSTGSSGPSALTSTVVAGMRWDDGKWLADDLNVVS